VEPYAFEFFNDPISLERETERARLGKLSPQRIRQIRNQERSGEYRRNVRLVKRPHPIEPALPHPDYRFYNKAANAIVYRAPTHVIYWKDDGDAVLTFKKNGNWYLHGVGGQKYFGREGLTWQLISQNFNVRYLPSGYILDSGAPCAFLREGVPPDELFFILGWTLSPLCQRLLKNVLNHTKNIQSKDFERLPYPFWIPAEMKERVIQQVRSIVQQAVRGRSVSRNDADLAAIGDSFQPSRMSDLRSHVQPRPYSRSAAQARLPFVAENKARSRYRKSLQRV
jgi:hypothetical protein